jgi:hypothetical protein
MTLGNMRANGVRSLDVSCWQCHHRTIMSADPWPDHVPVPSFGAHQRAASGLGGIDPFQCNPDRDRLSSVNFRG